MTRDPIGWDKALRTKNLHSWANWIAGNFQNKLDSVSAVKSPQRIFGFWNWNSGTGAFRSEYCASAGQPKSKNWLSQEPDSWGTNGLQIWTQKGRKRPKIKTPFLAFSHGFLEEDIRIFLRVKWWYFSCPSELRFCWWPTYFVCMHHASSSAHLSRETSLHPVTCFYCATAPHRFLGLIGRHDWTQAIKKKSIVFLCRLHWN